MKDYKFAVQIVVDAPSEIVARSLIKEVIRELSHRAEIMWVSFDPRLEETSDAKRE